MNVNFEYSKTLAIEGSILLLLSLIPYVGWVLGIVGVVLLLRSMKEFSNYYQDEQIYKNAFTGVKYYIVAIVAAAVAIAAITIGVWSATGFTADFVLTAGFGIGLVAFFAGSSRCVRVLCTCSIAPKKNLQYSCTEIRRSIV